MSSPITGSLPVAPPTTMSASDKRLIWLLLAAAFVAILNETTMGVAMPVLTVDFGIQATDAQWLTTAFMLTMAIVIPTTGFIMQRFTTRQVFLAAISLFTLGTALAFAAIGFEMLLVARVVQALGTAIMMPLLMTTVMSLVPPASRGQFMGRVSVVISLAPAIGPTMAGVVLDHFGWRWVFGIVLPIALIALIAGAKWMVNTGEPSHARVDPFSIVLSAFAFGGIVYGLSRIGGAHGAPELSAAERAAAESATQLTMIISLAVGVFALAMFIWRQLILQRRDDALLDLRVFLARNFSLAATEMFLLSLAFFGAVTVLPLYLINVHGFTATEAGLMMLPGALSMGLLGPVIGRIYDARGPRVLMIPGTIITAAVLWFYATSLTATTEQWIIIASHIALSLGLALSFTPLFTAGLGSINRSLYSHGSAVFGTIQQVAGGAGIALLITVMTATTQASAAAGASVADAGGEGTRAAFLIAAIIAVAVVAMSPLVVKPADDIEPAPHAH